MTIGRWQHLALLLLLPGGMLLGCGGGGSQTAPEPQFWTIIKPDGTGDYPTIQSAIDAADSSAVIGLAPGVFTGEGNRDIDFRGAALSLISETHDPETCVIDCQASWTDPHRGLIFQSGEGPGTTVTGVTIRCACAAGQSLEAYGGAVLCTNGSCPVLEDCVFADCRAIAGGGLYCDAASPTVKGCVFESDSSNGWRGAAVACNHGSSVILENCAFSDNAGWGVVSCTSSGANLSDCTFLWNEDSALHLVDSDAVLERCTFGYNYGAAAGAIYSASSSLEAIYCTFNRNMSTLGLAGAAYLVESQATFSSCTLYENAGGKTGGQVVLAAGTSAFFEKCILSRHSDSIACVDSSTVLLSCCDIYPANEHCCPPCVLGQIGQDGNMSADPMFCDPAAAVFRLTLGSPCGDGASGCGVIGAHDVGCD